MRLVSSWLILVVAATAPAVAAPTRYAITPAQVAAAVSGAGMQVDPSQVALLTGVVSKGPDPQLAVRSIEPQEGHRAIARLQCADHSQCLPFVVAIQLSRQSSAAPHAVPASVISVSEPVSRPSAAVSLRQGSSAVLLLESGPVHITLPVICLQSGSAGQTIRVTDRERRQIYMAQVVNENLLKGRF